MAIINIQIFRKLLGASYANDRHVRGDNYQNG